MKKLFYLLVLLLSTTVLSAQNAEILRSSRFSFGASLEAGYSGIKNHISNEYFNGFGNSDYTTTEERRPGYAVGLWSTYWLGPHWDIELGLNYGSWWAHAATESKNYNTVGIMTNYGRERYWVRQDLLRIPLQTRYYFGQPTNRVRPFLALGVQASYITSQNNFSRSIYGSSGQELVEYIFASDADLTAEYLDIRRWQWSMVGGIGIQMDRVTLSIQRNWPLNNTFKDDFQLYRYYPDYCSANVVGDVFFFCDYRVNQFRQTSLRFEYRIF